MSPPNDLPLFAFSYHSINEAAGPAEIVDSAQPSTHGGINADAHPEIMNVAADAGAVQTPDADRAHCFDVAIDAEAGGLCRPGDADGAPAEQPERASESQAVNVAIPAGTLLEEPACIAEVAAASAFASVSASHNQRTPRPVSERPATLAALLDEVTKLGVLDANALRHVTSDLRMTSKVTGVAVDRLPCAPVDLRPILKGVRPKRHSLSISRWSTIKSSVNRLLKFGDWVDQDHEPAIDLTFAWQRGIASLPQKGQCALFRGFARFCIARGVQPEDVTLATFENYGQWRRERTLTLDVTHATTSVRRVWRYLQKYNPQWPQTLIPAARDPRQFAKPEGEFRASFLAEVNHVMDNLAVIKPLDPRFRKRYSPFTIANTRQVIFRAATVVAAAQGGTHGIYSLRDVLAPAPLRIVMQEHFVRVGGDETWAPSAKTVAITLKRVAIASGMISEEELKEISKIVTLVTATGGSLSKKARDKVAQFYDPEMLKALSELPGRLFKEADAFAASGVNDRAARLYCRGLQLAILLVNPLRRKSLATLDMVRHFSRDKSGTVFRLYIPAGEVKNASTIEALLPPELAQRLETYLRDYRHHFENASSTFLFPGGDNGHVSPCTVARNLKDLVESELGVDFNVHLIRHIVSTLLIADDARNIILAQQLLGHRDAKTTERIYGHVRTHAAQKAWGETLGRRVSQITSAKKKPNRATKPTKGDACSKSARVDHEPTAQKCAKPAQHPADPAASGKAEVSLPARCNTAAPNAAVVSDGESYE